jgi:hypothetical protein
MSISLFLNFCCVDPHMSKFFPNTWTYMCLLTVPNCAQVHRKPSSDLVPFHQGGFSLDLSIQGSEANSQDSPSNLSI